MNGTCGEKGGFDKTKLSCSNVTAFGRFGSNPHARGTFIRFTLKDDSVALEKYFEAMFGCVEWTETFP
jgi:hypothetical protein